MQERHHRLPRSSLPRFTPVQLYATVPRRASRSPLTPHLLLQPRRIKLYATDLTPRRSTSAERLPATTGPTIQLQSDLLGAEQETSQRLQPSMQGRHRLWPRSPPPRSILSGL